MWKLPTELPSDNLKNENGEIYIIGLCDDGGVHPLCAYEIYFDGIYYWYPFTGIKANNLKYWIELPSA